MIVEVTKGFEFFTCKMSLIRLLEIFDILELVLNTWLKHC